MNIPEFSRRPACAVARQAAAVSFLLLILALAGCDGTGTPPAIPVLTITAGTESVTEGDSLRFSIRAEPAPPADLTVAVTIAYGGCGLAQTSKPVTIAAGASRAVDSSTTLTVKTDGAAAGCTVTATIAGGEGYRAGRTADGASASVDVSAATDSTPPRPPPAEPTVTIEADTTRVVLGSELIFTLTATPPPASDLEVTVQWSDPGAFLAERGRQQVTIPTAGTFKLRKPTEDDVAYQGEVEVTAALVAGSGYAIGTPASATVTVTGSVASTPSGPAPTPTPTPEPEPWKCSLGMHCPLVSVHAAAHVTESAPVSFTFTADPVPLSATTVALAWRYRPGRFGDRPETVTFAAGSGTASVTVQTIASAGADRNLFLRLVISRRTAAPDNAYGIGEHPVMHVTIDDA
ncbi:MAG: hypothetical protein OXP69_13340 [Spirochaetaceae bacterium]|nr:hypothetical protein [Spirochaetaceae bacterium]